MHLADVAFLRKHSFLISDSPGRIEVSDVTMLSNLLIRYRVFRFVASSVASVSFLSLLISPFADEGTKMIMHSKLGQSFLLKRLSNLECTLHKMPDSFQSVSAVFAIDLSN